MKKQAKQLMKKVVSGMAWKPTEEGDTIAGQIVSRTVIDTKFGQCPQLEVHGESGEVYTVLSNKADLRILNRVPVGTAIKLVYQGTAKVAGKKTPKDVFDVYIPLKCTLEADWTNGDFYNRDNRKPRGKKSAKAKKTSRR